MSAVAIPFDTHFSMGPRSSFPWPDAFESSSSVSSMLGQDFSSILPPVSESSVSPPMSYRTMSPSPPRIFKLEQRDFKRQRDRVRRDSRVSARAQRAGSSSYMGSPPLSLSDSGSSMSLPVYTTAPTSVSILAEPSMGGQSYLPPYSPPLQDTQVFSSPYQQPLQPSYSMSMEYPGSYAAPSEFGIPPSSIPVTQDMYRIPAVMNESGASSASSAGPGAAAGQEGSHVRVVQGRPKPRCWEHGCNGRQFSTFSNLLRHQREKSGQATKATCPNCGAEFTRTTARNGHLLHDKCKQRRST